MNNGPTGKNRRIWLSPSGIETLERCPRCFWLQYKRGIRQPEGIVSRLPNRFDEVIKQYFNTYRREGKLPPWIEGKVEGKLQCPFQETYFHQYNDRYGVYGKLDECLVTEDRLHTPVDHKTASSDPREKDVLPAYQAQVDFYAFLLEVNRKPTSGIAYLIYFYPDMSNVLHKGFPMMVHIQTLRTDPMRAEERIARAIEVLEGPLPQPSSLCPFCEWRERVNQEIG